MAATELNVRYRPVHGFPGYRVGDDGSVWSCWGRVRGKGVGRSRFAMDETHWKKRKPVSNKWGYLLVGMIPGPGRRQIHKQVHRLVLQAFVGPCPPEMECCHWDGNRRNNALDNLRWDTRSGNRTDSLRHGTSHRGVQNPAARLTPADVLEIRVRYHDGETQTAIARSKGVTQSLVWRIVHRLLWRHV